MEIYEKGVQITITSVCNTVIAELKNAMSKSLFGPSQASFSIPS